MDQATAEAGVVVPLTPAQGLLWLALTVWFAVALWALGELLRRVANRRDRAGER